MIEDFESRNTEQWKRYSYLTIGIFVLIVAGLLIKNSFNKKNSTNNSQNTTTNIVIPDIVRAEPKKVADGFPKELALNSKIEIIGSYSASYPNSSAKQTTVEFISSQNPEDNFNFYTKWAENGGWQVINSSKSDLISSLYFKKTLEAINITIRPTTKNTARSNVVISHIDLNQ